MPRSLSSLAISRVDWPSALSSQTSGANVRVRASDRNAVVRDRSGTKVAATSANSDCVFDRTLETVDVCQIRFPGASMPRLFSSSAIDSSGRPSPRSDQTKGAIASVRSFAR